MTITKRRRKDIRIILCLLLIGTSFPIVKSEEKQQFIVTDLTSDYRQNPIGLDISPLLSWKLEASRRGTVQTAYRIIVSSSLENLNGDNGDIWDSGKVNSSKSVGILYNGAELVSRQRYHWKVTVWTDNGHTTYVSAPAFFEMGLIEQSDWRSGWIGYVPGMPGRVQYFNGVFTPQKEIKQSRAYIAGLGFYELYINNKKVGDHVLDPAQTNYSKRVYYVTYDISDFFTQEQNSIVIPVAPGWLGTQRLRVQIEVTYQDDSREILTSDRFRHVAVGPTVYSSIFDGELYDARINTPSLLRPGEAPAGLMDKKWAWSHNTDDPKGKMMAQKIEPIRVVETLTPTIISEPTPGVYVFDAGRNLAGWAALRTEGKPGTEVKLRFAETLYDNGLINQDNLRNAKAEDIYILKGEGIESWEPAFTYHGFRYVQVEGLENPPKPGDIRIKVVRTDVATTGSFHTSNKLLNDIHQIVVNTEASNLHSVPTDCPQRDERMGWLNDLTVRIEQAIYNFDMSRFYDKFIDDIEDTQENDGTITDVVPFRFGMRPADPVSASYLILAQKSYEFYNNSRMIDDHYDGMKAWVDYLYTRTNDGLVEYSYYGDWCPPRDFLMDPNGSGISRDTPGQLMSTGYLYHCARILSDMAERIDRPDDVVYYKKLSDEIATAFNREYWNEETGGYASNNQASNSFALYLGIVDEDKVPRVISNLVEDVKKQDYHLTTGNLCTKYLLEVLSDYGYSEIAYKIATQTTYPSWGYMLANGATTLWERWEHLTGDAMNSHNHPMMGSVGSWFYKYVLGIAPSAEHPGFEQFTLKPFIFKDLDFVEGQLETMRGTIKISWRKEKNNLLKMDVTIPPNSTATLYLPTIHQSKIREGGKNISRINEIEIVGAENGNIVARIGSGEWSFEIKQ